MQGSKVPPPGFPAARREELGHVRDFRKWRAGLVGTARISDAQSTYTVACK